MIIARINPEESCDLNFNLAISGSDQEPSDIRFIIEGQMFDGEMVQDVFSIICRAVRTDDGIRVYIPKLLNLFKAGSYKSRLEVILENRLFVPVSEEIVIEEPLKVESTKPVTKPKIEISASFFNEKSEPEIVPVKREPKVKVNLDEIFKKENLKIDNFSLTKTPFKKD